MDSDLKKQAESLFDNMGLSMTAAITVFVKTAVRKGKIPFEVAADPFYSEENQERLTAAIADLNAGRGLVARTIMVQASRKRFPAIWRVSGVGA
jgi:DNA-damage-inducible protein J